MDEAIDCLVYEHSSFLSVSSVPLRNHNVDMKKSNLRKQNQKAGVKHKAAKQLSYSTG